MEKICVNLPNGAYQVTVGNDLLNKAYQTFNLNRKVLIVTDNGVPEQYAKTLAKQCKQSLIVTVEQGEGSKSFAVLQSLLEKMCQFGMDRGDCVVAVGGGVVGDLAGFTASCYMRGVDFYNIPTTLLSQVDSSIGGKTAINFCGIKNVVGAFYQPKGVLIDIDLLRTLSERQISCGLAEAVKMSITSDASLFEFFENNSLVKILCQLDYVIVGCLNVKKQVVENDEKEKGLRKVLNFGHTIGHTIEAQQQTNGLFHGECVAIGMCAITHGEIKDRLIKVLQKIGLPTRCEIDSCKMKEFLLHDKKIIDGNVDVVLVDNVGEFRFEKASVEQIIDMAIKSFGEN